MKAFPQTLLETLFSRLEEAIRSARSPLIAAFDADGTLWSFDIGETFFDYQIRKQLLPDLPADPWAHYKGLKLNPGPEAAYLWLAQINKGQPLERVLHWSRQNIIEQQPLPIFDFQKQLIRFLLERRVQVYIVTASIAWAVEPAAEQLGIPAENVIGVRTQVKNGLVTEEQEGVITYREGKVAALLEKTGNHRPLFAVGNTEGDLALLESATDLRLVIASAIKGEGNYATEQSMQKTAMQRGWFHHSFSD